jgi:hypothetical protein
MLQTATTELTAVNLVLVHLQSLAAVAAVVEALQILVQLVTQEAVLVALWGILELVLVVFKEHPVQAQLV